MAMSRSFGARSLTTSPPILRSPSEMSSRPAIIRSAVDFPQPDGPTRIISSPSRICRFMCLTASKPSGYRLTTSSNSISAMWGWLLSALDRARGQAGDDALLEEQHEEDQRNRDDDRCRRDRPEGQLELRRAGEERDRRRNGARARRRRQRDGEQELVPHADERQDAGGREARRRERHDDLAERLEVRRPVDERRLLEVPRDLLEERDEDVDRQRQGEREVRDDQPDPRVVDADVRPEAEQRRRDRDGREGRDRQDDRKDGELAPEPQPRERVGAERANGQRRGGGEDGHHRAVEQRAREIAVAEDRVVILESRAR